MAETYPRSLAPNTPASERAVWTALKSLPDAWKVFHSVEWQAERSGRPGDGEADFVLLHPEFGFIVVEVKGGGIAVGGKQWYSFDRAGKRHEIDDPFEQAKTSKYTLIDHLNREISDLPFLPAGHAVSFPDINTTETLGINAPSTLLLSKSDLSEPVTAIGQVCAHWELSARLSEDTISAITAVLAPSKDLRRTTRDDVHATSAQIDFWTGEQTEALDALRRNRRQIIYGGAGTGKTVLAAEKARRLAADDKRVLLTCFNQPLARSIAETLRDVERIQVSGFHALCRSLADRAGLKFPRSPDSVFWDQGAPDLLVEGAMGIGFHVDAVVVDEAQDFATPWFTALELLLTEPETGEFYVFADSHQAIYRDGWTPPFDGPEFELTKNCRNTLAIAQRVAAVYGDKVSTLGASGTAPEFVEVVNQEGTVRALRGLVHRLLNEGKLERHQLAVLCQRKQDVEELRRLSFAGHPTADLDAWGDGILVETIHRFKGLESDAAIVVLERLDQSWDQALAYIGMSRARAQLFVVGPDAVRNALVWN